MKKFLIFVFTVIIAYIMFDFAYYRWGFYLPNNKEVEVVSYTENKKMYMKDQDTYKEITVKGVNIGGSLPGRYVTDYAITYDTYYAWFESILEMGANTIRLNTIFNDKFYNALFDFNQNHEEKLYLIQGINLDSYALNSHYDGYDRNFYGELITQAENAVDVVHGRKKLTMAKSGKGNYKKDVSEYVLAYIVGSEWVDDTILYTDKKEEAKIGFNGNYIQTTSDVTAFETMLAKVIDHLITYETNKYSEQHNMSFINSPETDPIALVPKIILDDETEASHLTPESLKYFYHKIVKVDLDHLQTKGEYKGLFASYNVSSYYPNYLSYENKEYEDTYLSYLEQLTAHHKSPVLVTEFAYSTARSISTVVEDGYGNFGGMTEEEQGNALVKAYNSILKSGSVGGVIATWQDEWDKRSWNSIEKVDTTRSIYWSDAQTTNQGLGLLTFDPGSKESVCYVDGEITEWQGKDKIAEEEDLSLSVKQDEKYLYLYINRKNKGTGPIYIPFDITYKSGSKTAKDYNLTFDRDVDFLMVLNGQQGELFVQEYYNVLEAIDGYELKNVNSYIKKPVKDSSVFEPINLLIEPYSSNKYSKNYRQATLVNTGKLTYGNANPLAGNFNSQADFYEVDGKIEIRIPWQILNFSDPSKMKIHDDYYENYGVDGYTISKIYIGASTKSSINLKPYGLKSWDNSVKYHERLKKSYYIVQNDWRNIP